jgi:hypothetical protein
MKHLNWVDGRVRVREIEKINMTLIKKKIVNLLVLLSLIHMPSSIALVS